jgi:vanadium chloroperoxidase
MRQTERKPKQIMDQILYWNDVALEANRVSHTQSTDAGTLGPPLSARAMGIVHLAMYDAFAGASNNPATLPSYLPNLGSAGSGASIDAAIAAAAHATLSKLFPSQRPFFDLQLAQAGVPGAADPGHQFGQTVAELMLADRANDPSASSAGYNVSQARGAHRPDPDNPEQGVHAPFYGAQAKGFAISSRHVLAKPPQVGSSEYLKALREVRAKGIVPELTGTLPGGPDFRRRTPDETMIGLFWAYDGAAQLGTPVRLYNQIVRKVAIAKGNTLEQNARLFAFVNAALADAGILAWAQKYVHDLWRPVVAIREHDTSLGPSAVPGVSVSEESDPSWLPLGAPKSNATGKNFTPPFPAYPSGHATFGAAALHITRLFYGITTRGPDNLLNGVEFISDELDGVTRDNKGTVRPRHSRKFPGGLWEMIEENGRSRVFLGVHWVFDAFAVNNSGKMDLDRNIGGVPLGLKIAEDIFNAGDKKAPKKSSV